MKSLPHDLFARALEMEPAARDAFLNEACGDNAELHLEVRSLLVDSERADLFFGDADGVTLGAEEFKDTYAEKEGDQVGPYKLRQQIGEGGFGTVWMAEQRVPISRMVALKVIKAGMDTKQVLARFEAERQALAMMDHPNIAKVLDAGATAAGRPYFAMELVKGIPITQYCDESGLGTRERLALFGDICSAINHAHQKGIIHRDIKPSNVMITLYADQPVVKVIDFGIAKATQGKLTDQTLFTRFEQFVGTPVYMSPEQANLSAVDIDTRSDIYALGILLYELLTGKPPFDAKSLLSAGYEEMRRIICEVEPPKPSARLSTVVGEERTSIAKARHIESDKLNRLVEPDLDWIVMKAIEKDRARRYETANGLAADIGRFLADEPVSATPPSAGYQFRKFAKRNRVAIRVAATIAAVLVAATIISAWQAVRATQAQGMAKREVERATREAKRATMAEQKARDQTARATKAEALATDQADQATRAAARAMAAEKQAKDEAARAIDAEKRTAVTLDQVKAERDAKEEARQDALAISTFLIEVFESPDPARDGRTITVVETLDTAVKKLEKGLADQPRRRANLQATLGGTYLALGLFREAIPLLEKVRDSYVANLGPEHSETLGAMSDLAVSYFDAGRKTEALQLQEQVLLSSRKVNGGEHRVTLLAMNNLAKSYFEAGRTSEASKLQEESLPLIRRVFGPEDAFTLLQMNNLAVFYDASGRTAEALKRREEVLTLSQKVNGSKHPDTLRAMHNLASSYEGAGRKEDALKLREEVLALYREVSGGDHPDTLRAMHNLAVSYFKLGRNEEALRMREELLTLSRKVNGADHPDTLMAMYNLAISYSDNGRQEEALKLREEVLPASREVNGAEHPDTLGAMSSLANSYFGAGRKEEALKLREELLPLSLKVNGAEHRATLGAMTNLGGSYQDAGRFGESIQLLEKSLAIKRRVLSPADPYRFVAMRMLASSYTNVGRTHDALPLLAELVAQTPDDTETALGLAALQAWLGKDEDHAATSQRMIKWAGITKDPGTLERIAKLTSLRGVTDLATREAALAFARDAVKLGRPGDNAGMAWSQLALGMAEFRNAHYPEAMEALLESAQEANSMNTRNRSLIQGIAGFYRSMSLYQAGRLGEARAVFTDTEAKMKPFPADEKNPLVGNAYHDDLIFWLACKEARAMLVSELEPASKDP